MTTSTLYESPSFANQSFSGTAGTVFSSSVNGTITALRFFKSSSETGTHTGYIWQVGNSTALASVVFTGESASGWQQMSLATPLAITSGTNYVVGVNVVSQASRNVGNLSTSRTNSTSQLTIPANGGRYIAGSTGIPTTSDANSYGTSLVFDDGLGNPLTSGTASVSSVGNTIASLVCTAASGGTSPYTYQWYRSTTSGFTPGAGNLVSGATALTLNDTGLTNNTTYYYKLIATDSAGTPATVTSNQISATPVAAALAAGTASLTSRINTPTANITTTAPTNGTPSYTYQWQTSTDNTTFTNISGGTTATYAYSPGANGLYYLRCLYSDAGSGSATSNVITVVLSTEQLFLGFIGDSITAGTVSGSPPSPTTANTVLETLNGYRMCSFLNRGVSGSTTTQWIVGQTNYTNALSALNTASSGFSKKYVLIMLGTNDCSTTNNISKTTYKANLLNLCNGLISNGYIVVLNYPIWTSDSNRSLSLLLQYQAAINELVNGTTILQGDTFSYQYFLQNQSQIVDTIHPNQTGENNLGTLWAYAFWRTVYSVKVAARRSLKL